MTMMMDIETLSIDVFPFTADVTVYEWKFIEKLSRSDAYKKKGVGTVTSLALITRGQL